MISCHSYSLYVTLYTMVWYHILIISRALAESTPTVIGMETYTNYMVGYMVTLTHFLILINNQPYNRIGFLCLLHTEYMAKSLAFLLLVWNLTLFNIWVQWEASYFLSVVRSLCQLVIRDKPYQGTRSTSTDVRTQCTTYNIVGNR